MKIGQGRSLSATKDDGTTSQVDLSFSSDGDGVVWEDTEGRSVSAYDKHTAQSSWGAEYPFIVHGSRHGDEYPTDEKEEDGVANADVNSDATDEGHDAWGVTDDEKGEEWDEYGGAGGVTVLSRSIIAEWHEKFSNGREN